MKNSLQKSSESDLAAKMSPIEKAEHNQKLIEQYKAAEFALHLIDRAIMHDAHIMHIKAEDDALAERSIYFDLTPMESAEVFKVVGEALKARIAAIEAKLA